MIRIYPKRKCVRKHHQTPQRVCVLLVVLVSKVHLEPPFLPASCCLLARTV